METIVGEMVGLPLNINETLSNNVDHKIDVTSKEIFKKE